MRKLLLALVIFIQLINVRPLEVYAADDDKEYNYTVFYNWVSKSGGSEFVDTFNMSLTSTTQFVAYWGIKFDQYVLMLKPYELSTVLSDDVVFSSGGLSGYSANFDMTYEYKRDGKVVATLHNVNGVGSGVLMWEHSRRDTPSFFDDEILNTNIPIFHTEEDADKFIKGELTEKDAINYETDLCKVVYDLEVPQNLQCVGMKDDELSIGNLIYNDVDVPQLSFKWEQTDPNHTKWTTEIYCYENFRYRKSVLLYTFDEWFYVDDYFLFSDTVDTYKKYWNQFMKKSVTGWRDRNEKYDEDDFETLLTVLYFRNAWYDSDSGLKHYSNWVKVEYDWSSGDVITSYYEIEGSDIEINDSTGAISKPSGDVVADSQYTGTDYDGYMEQSSSDLLGWIKTGFGLGGENGVIALLGETFSFIPPELWSVFLAGISLFVVVAVVKFIRG